jgi:hypothetical protein
MLLWLAPILFVALMLASAAGYGLSRRVVKSGGGQGAGWGPLLGGASGLLGLLIAFTLAMATERYETRRELVVSEANALSTTYLRDSAYGGAAGARLDALIAQYGQARLAFFDAGDDKARLDEVGRRTGALKDEIWKETVAAVLLPRQTAIDAMVLASTNEMFNVAASRMAARQLKVPQDVLWLLTFIAIGTSALCGYTLGLSGDRHMIATAALMAMISVSIATIVDLDTPTLGLIQVPQSPMINAVADLKAHEARRQTFVPDVPAESAADPDAP